MTIGPELLAHIHDRVYNPKTDPDMLRGYAVLLVGAVETLTDSVEKLTASLNRIHGIAYPVDNPVDIANLTPLEMAINKVLIEAENTLHSLEET